MSEIFFTRDTIPDGPFMPFQKVYVTPATKIDGTFHCVTSEGNVASCTDGWLAIDSRGYPYPINNYEFELTYRPAEEPK